MLAQENNQQNRKQLCAYQNNSNQQLINIWKNLKNL
jgi:hypothetical protein